MAKKAQHKIDFSKLQADVKAQFSNLDPNDPSLWPSLPRNLLLLTVVIAVVVAGWFLWLVSVRDELQIEQDKEVQLRQVYVQKLSKAVSLEELKKQLEQVRQYVAVLEKQLPSKAEMDALLSDINQAGLGRSLQFELFRPGQVAVKEYYAELPIAIKTVGSYHDAGMFASDVAHLSRIVTLNDLSFSPVKDKPGMLVMEGVAKTFRYLDPNEIEAQKKATQGKPVGAP
jgi:type IV pilus assembly protein PilO